MIDDLREEDGATSYRVLHLLLIELSPPETHALLRALSLELNNDG